MLVDAVTYEDLDIIPKQFIPIDLPGNQPFLAWMFYAWNTNRLFRAYFHLGDSSWSYDFTQPLEAIFAIARTLMSW